MSQLLEMKNVTKIFPGVKALDKVNLSLSAGKTHILLGENGAGKSTLIKVLSGAHQPEEGDIYINGEKATITDPSDAFKYGISVIYQEFQLAPNLTIYENIFLGRELTNSLNFINKKETIDKTKEVMEFVGLDVSPETLVKDLSVAQKQMVEITKALVFDSNIIVFDEPTATLTDKETKRLFEIIHQLEEEGIGIIYISHRLEEFKEIGEKCTVLRDGKHIDTVKLADTSKEKLVNLMTGRKIEKEKDRLNICSPEQKILEVKNLSYKEEVKDVSFDLCKQEILGIGGLVGAGRTELAKTLMGEYTKDSGEIYLKNKKVELDSPAEAIKNDLFYLSEDRKDEGLFLGHSVKDNITVSSLSRFTKKGVMKNKHEEQVCNDLIEKLDIKTPNMHNKTLTLSGGNQQKVVIAKGLCKQAQIYIFDEPTRGIDVGAKEEIYEIMDQLIQDGSSIIVISSDLPELLRISDRIMVMADGHLVDTFINDEDLSQQEILSAAVGGGKN
ncbi:MAG: sugar ABC transporter ATP-binding protein [Halanaerobiales bacterium]